MNEYENMINTLQEYYGCEYTPIMKTLLIEYFKKEVKKQDLKKVFSLVIKSFSHQYKTPPDIAIFEKILSENYYNTFVSINNDVCMIENDNKYICDGKDVSEEVNNLLQKLKNKFRKKK